MDTTSRNKGPGLAPVQSSDGASERQLAALIERHTVLDVEVANLQRSPGVSDLKLKEMKLAKLKLKDLIKARGGSTPRKKR